MTFSLLASWRGLVLQGTTAAPQQCYFIVQWGTQCHLPPSEAVAFCRRSSHGFPASGVPCAPYICGPLFPQSNPECLCWRFPQGLPHVAWDPALWDQARGRGVGGHSLCLADCWATCLACSGALSIAEWDLTTMQHTATVVRQPPFTPRQLRDRWRCAIVPGW